MEIELCEALARTKILIWNRGPLEIVTGEVEGCNGVEEETRRGRAEVWPKCTDQACNSRAKSILIQSTQVI